MSSVRPKIYALSVILVYLKKINSEFVNIVDERSLKIAKFILETLNSN